MSNTKVLCLKDTPSNVGDNDIAARKVASWRASDFGRYRAMGALAGNDDYGIKPLVGLSQSAGKRCQMHNAHWPVARTLTNLQGSGDGCCIQVIEKVAFPIVMRKA